MKENILQCFKNFTVDLISDTLVAEENDKVAGEKNIQRPFCKGSF